MICIMPTPPHTCCTNFPFSFSSGDGIGIDWPLSLVLALVDDVVRNAKASSCLIEQSKQHAFIIVSVVIVLSARRPLMPIMMSLSKPREMPSGLRTIPYLRHGREVRDDDVMMNKKSYNNSGKR